MNLEQFEVCDQDLTPDLLDRYLEASEVAVDTETLGLIPQRDRLCLVQLCDPTGYVTAIRIHRGQTQSPHLKRLLEEPAVTKVFHYARFDVAQFLHTFGIQTLPIFCTKIASKLARTYTSNHGLKSLVQELEGVELDKSSQSSDWGNRENLSPEQLSYAANDVRYLLPVKDKLITMLEREERLDLAEKAFTCIPILVTLDLLQYKDIFEH